MKKNLLLLITGAAFYSCSFAQDHKLPEKYASEIAVESARKHLTILASDAFEGRDTGKPGGHKAAEYLANEFKKLGLTAPVNQRYLQAVPLVDTRFTVQDFSINGTSMEAGQGFYMTGAGNQKTISTNSIVFIGYGIDTLQYSDLKDIDIKGKVVLLINEGEPVDAQGKSYITKSKTLSNWSKARNKRIKAVLEKNPAFVLATSSQVAPMLKRYAGYVNRSRMMLKEDYKAEADAPAVAHISTEIADQLLTKANTTVAALKAKINKQGKSASQSIPVDFATSYGTHVEDLDAANVLGYLEGGDLKDELVVISAHYDHVGVDETGDVYNGADDDGSGTTGVLEMAKAFVNSKNEGHGPRRTILFLLVTGEERGLLGSDYYTRHPVFPLQSTVADLNIDMIGRIDPPHEDNPNYIYLIGSDKLSSTLHALSEQANEEFTQLQLDYKYNDPNDPERIYYRSDHYNFAKNKIPVIFYFNGIHEDYHKVTDTVDKINFELLVKRTKLVFHTAWKVANGDQRPLVDSNKK